MSAEDAEIYLAREDYATGRITLEQFEARVTALLNRDAFIGAFHLAINSGRWNRLTERQQEQICPIL